MCQTHSCAGLNGGGVLPSGNPTRATNSPNVLNPRVQISMVVAYPLAIQHVQESVPWAHAGHEDVLNAGWWCSGVMAVSFIASCLLYLVRGC